MSSLDELYERGEPLPFKARAYAKYIAHGHLAAASHHENVLWAVICAESNDEGVLTPE